MWVPPPRKDGLCAAQRAERHGPSPWRAVGDLRAHQLHRTDGSEGPIWAIGLDLQSTCYVLSLLLLFFWGRASKNIGLELVFYSTLLRRPGNIGKHSVAPRGAQTSTCAMRCKLHRFWQHLCKIQAMFPDKPNRASVPGTDPGQPPGPRAPKASKDTRCSTP